MFIPLTILLVGGLLLSILLAVVATWNRDIFDRWINPPELFMIESKQERVRAQTTAFREFLYKPTTLLMIAVVLLTHIVDVISDIGPGGAWDASEIVILIVFALCNVVAIIDYRNSMRTSLRRHLNEHGQPACMACGYDLRGQVDEICPECGRVALKKIE